MSPQALDRRGPALQHAGGTAAAHPRPARGARRRRSTRSRQQLRAEHAVNGRLPDPVARRAESLHGLHPAGRAGGLDIWVATPPAPARPLGGAGEPGRARQLAGGRLLPDADPRRRALLRQPGGAARHLRTGRHLLHPPNAPAWLERARASGLRARRAQQRARRTGSLVRAAGWKASLYFSRSSATRSPATIFVATASAGGASGPRPRSPSSTTRPPTTSSRTSAATGARSSCPRTARARSAHRTSGSRRGAACTIHGRPRSTSARP